MKYLDTNVLIRVITGDVPTLAEAALATIENGSPGEYCIIDAVLVELCFVLEFHTYHMSRKDIAAALDVLIGTPQIAVSDTTKSALSLYAHRPVLDYVDCLLFALGGSRGVITFDKDLQTELLGQEQQEAA